jgi:ankyrin repeat protein
MIHSLKKNAALILIMGCFFVAVRAMEEDEYNGSNRNKEKETEQSRGQKRKAYETEGARLGSFTFRDLQKAISNDDITQARNICATFITQRTIEENIIRLAFAPDVDKSKVRNTMHLAIEKEQCYPLLGLMHDRVRNLRSYYDYAVAMKKPQAALFLGMVGGFVDDQKVKEFIQAQADVNASYFSGCNGILSELPLSMYCITSLEKLKILIANGLDVNGKSSDGTHLIAQAVMIGQPKILSLLIDHGADVNLGQDNNIRGLKNAPALQIALNVTFERMAKILIDAGACVNNFDDRGVNLIAWHAKNAKSSLIPLLREKGCKGLEENTPRFDVQLKLPMHRLKKDADRDADLRIAIAFKDCESIQILLEAGASIYSVDNDGISILEAARKSGSEEIMKLFAPYIEEEEQHVDVEKETETGK